MALTNYRDLSTAGSHLRAGFQFEFYCANCPRKWKSHFEPYRRGQIAGLIFRIGRFVDSRGTILRGSSALANAGERRAHENALEEALEQAAQQYAECPVCNKAVCLECWDADAGRCRSCDGGGTDLRTNDGHEGRSAEAVGAREAGSLKCPNCSAPMSGGRFCPECGFDMASTHKTCPGCGAMCLRSARFCGDCGHGF